MIRDTSAQHRMVEVKPNRERRLLLIGGAMALLAVLAFAMPGMLRLFFADASVSAPRLAFATVERGPFVRDIAADGKVLAANIPTPCATYRGAAVLKVRAGDGVKQG